MVRPADLRKRKYEGKVDPETLAIQTRALKPLMVRGETLYFPAIATVEEKVKRLVEGEGVPTIQVRDYLNFGREMYELTKKFSGSTLAGEAQLRVNKWSGRGLTGSLLVRIAQLFGVTPSAPPEPPSVLDLINMGVFPIMIAERLLTSNYLIMQRGTGYELLFQYGWQIYTEAGEPPPSYQIQRGFAFPFRRTPLYLTGFKFSLEKTGVNRNCELYWGIYREVDGISELVMEGELSNAEIPDGISHWSYPISPPVYIPFELAFNLEMWLHVWGNDSYLRVFKCFVETKLKP